MTPLSWFLFSGWMASNAFWWFHHKRMMQLTREVLDLNASLVHYIRVLKGIDPPDPRVRSN